MSHKPTTCQKAWSDSEFVCIHGCSDALPGRWPGPSEDMCLVTEKTRKRKIDQEELSLQPLPYMDKFPNTSHRCIFQVDRGVLQLGNWLLDQRRNKRDCL